MDVEELNIVIWLLINGLNYVNELLAVGLNIVSANDIMCSKLFL